MNIQKNSKLQNDFFFSKYTVDRIGNIQLLLTRYFSSTKLTTTNKLFIYVQYDVINKNINK